MFQHVSGIMQGSSSLACLEMNGTEGNAGLGLTYKVPQTLYKENRDKLCARLRQAGVSRDRRLKCGSF